MAWNNIGSGGGGSTDLSFLSSQAVYLSGRWVDARAITGSASSGLYPTINQLQLTPLVLSRTVSFSAIAVNVSVAHTTTTVRLGVYSSNAEGYPDAVLAEGSISTATPTGIKSAAISLTLEPGIYYLAFVPSSANAEISYIGATALRPLIGTATGAGSMSTHMHVTNVAYVSALPNPFPTSGATYAISGPYLVSLQVT